jgi:hypothetical protein
MKAICQQFVANPVLYMTIEETFSLKLRILSNSYLEIISELFFLKMLYGV